MARNVVFRQTAVFVLLFLIVAGCARAQDMAQGQLLIRGASLQISPTNQEVDPGRPTVVNTRFGGLAPGDVPADWRAVGELSGPGLDSPLVLSTVPGEPFRIPGLTREGTYVLSGIRLEAGGTVLAAGEPDAVEIMVHRLVIASVTSRPLTPEEMAAAGIVIDDGSYTVWRYSVGFATESGTYEIPFDLAAGPEGLTLLPDQDPYRLLAPSSPPPAAPPQIHMVNIEITDGTLPVTEDDVLQKLPPPSIPGFLIIPGDVAFLHQFFSAILVVQNGALEGSGIELRDLSAVLEPADDGVRQAETEPPTVPGELVPVMDPGPDGQPGTADDLTFIVARSSGQATWYIEGLSEGQHLIRVRLAGEIDGLASGQPARFETTVPGVVVVRDPRFALTFVHPWTVRAGELYRLEVVISNTSVTPVYDLHMSLPSTELSGAQLADPGAAEQVIGELAPGESASVSWELMSLKTGRVVASAFNTSSSMTASFRFHAGVGELGIPLSPDSLVLPPDVYDLPQSVTEPAVELLGLAHSLANAPPGAELTLPPVAEGMVIRRGQELAAAARRARLGEAQDRCLLDVGLKWLGTATWDPGWDALRRASRRGHDLEYQLGLVLGRRIDELGLDAALDELAEVAISGRPLLVVAAEGAGYQGNARLLLSGALSQMGAAGQEADTTFFSRDLAGAAVIDVDSTQFRGEIGLVSVPVTEDGSWGEGSYQVQLRGVSSGSVSVRATIVMPDGSTRSFRPAPIATAANSLAFFTIAPELDPVQVYVDSNGDSVQDGAELVAVQTAPAPAPRLLVARFDDTLQPPDGGPYRSILLLFSQMLDNEALADLDPQGWIAASHLELPATGTPLVVDRPRVAQALVQQIDPHVLVAVMSAPLNPHAQITLSSGGEAIPFLGGQSLVIDGEPVETGNTLASGAVRGVVVGADGAPVAGASVELYEMALVDDPIQGPTWLMVLSDSVVADGSGRFVLDAVRDRTGQVEDRYGAFLLRAVEPGTSHEAKIVTRLDGDGAVLDLTVAMVGRGDVVGTLSREDGRPLESPEITARSAIDPTQGAAGAVGTDGSFLISGLPVGPVQIAARDGGVVTFATAFIPGPGQQGTVDLVLPAGAPRPTAGVSGQVVSAVDGSGMRGIKVYLVPDGQAGAVAVATTSADGSFTMDGVPADPAWLKAYDPARSLYVGRKHVDLLADSVTTVQIVAQEPAAASVEGVVFRQVSGARVPVEGVYVVAAQAGRYAITGADGSFRLDELPLGDVNLTATDPTTGDNASASLTLTAAGQVQTVELDLTESQGSIQGTVVNRDGVPVYGAAVAVGRFGGGLETCTDEAGEFVVPGVEPGTHDVLVQSADGKRFGRRQATVLYNGDAASVTVVLGGTVSLEVVTVADTTGGGTAEVLSQFEYKRPGITSEGRLGLLPEDHRWLACAQESEGSECSIDAAGHAQFTGLPEGVGPLVVRATNAFYGRSSVAENLDPADDGRTLTIDFSAPGTLSGRVTDWEGEEPVEGATVQLWIKDDDDAWQPQQAVTAGPDGGFFFELVRPGGFRITAFDPVTGTPGWIEGRIGSAQVVSGLEIHLHRLGSVSGAIELCARADAPAGRGDEVHLRLTPDNVPVPLLDGLTPPALAVHEDDTDLSSGGQFTFTGLASGRWMLWASSGLHGTAVIPVTVPEDGGEMVLGEPVCLHPAGSVAGVVRDPLTAEPVANASVQLWVDAVPPYVATTDLSAADGSFLFTPLPVGKRYHVAAFDPASNRGGASSPVMLCSTSDPGFGDTCVQDAEVEVELQPEGRVQGNVTTADGDPVEGAFVSLRGQVITGQSGSIVTAGIELWAFSDAAGEFSFDGVPAGTTTIAAFAPDSHLWREVEVQVDPVTAPVTVADITLPPLGQVTVRVLDPAGVPLDAESTVVAYRQSSNHYLEPSNSGGRVEGLLQGAETIFSVVEGDYELGVCAGTCVSATVDDVLFHRFPGALAAYAHPSMPDPPEDGLVELQLVGRAALAVRVLDGNGQPAGGAQVTVSGSGFYGPVILTAQTGPDGGAGPFEGLGVGTYTVAATLTDGSGNVIRGVSPAEIRQEDNGRTIDVDVSLETAGSASGQVVDAEGAPAAGALVTMSFTDGAEPRRFQVVTAGDGSFEFPALPADHGYELEAAEGNGGRGVYRDRGISVGTDHLDLGVLQLDEHDPVVAAVSPEAGSSEVNPAEPVVVEFSELIRHETLYGSRIVLRRGSAAVAASLTVEDLPDPDGEGPRGEFTRVTLDHGQLASDALYLVDVLQGVEDLAGRTLPVDFHASFRTADTIPPFVAGVVPADDPQGFHPVGPDVEPVITFSEAVDPASVDGSTVRILDSDGTEVTLQRVVESSGFAVRLRPDTALALDGVYTLVVGGVTDTSGNAMTSEYRATFRVRDAQPPVTGILPPEGATVEGDTWSAVEGTSIVLRAAVTSNDALDWVAFAVDGVRLGESPILDGATGEYRLSWTVPAGQGEHVLSVQAGDVSGNLSDAASHGLVVVDDAPPAGTLSLDPAQEILPNHLLTLTVTGQDDRGLARAHLELHGAVEVVEDRSFPSGSTEASLTATYRIPATAAAGSQVVAGVTVVDSFGQETPLPPATVTVLADVQEPAITVSAPAGGASVTAGDTVFFGVTVTDDVEARTISLTVDGEEVPVTVGDVVQPGQNWQAWVTAQWVAPAVSQSAEISYTLIARDLSGNEGMATGSITVEPLVNPEAPVVAIACPMDGDPCLPGIPLTISFTLSDDDQVDSYDIVVNGIPVLEDEPVNATNLSTTYQWTPPAEAQPGDTFTIRIQARDFASNLGNAEIALTVPAGTILTGERTLDSRHDGETFVLGPGTFTIDTGLDELSPENLILAQGAILATTTMHSLAIDATGEVHVACGAVLEASGYGYSGGSSTSSGGAPAGVPGSETDAGGSHAGIGVAGNQAGPAGEAYGSVYEAGHAGGGGGYGEGGSSLDGRAGGGVVRIDTGDLVLEGKIRARGIDSHCGWDPAGGGGSVILRVVGSLSGSGVVDVSGGASDCSGDGAGGAGRVVVEAGTLNGFDPEAQVVARGGARQRNVPINYAGAGTVYVKTSSSTYGDLIVDQGGAGGKPVALTPLPVLGAGTVGTVTEDGSDAWITPSDGDPDFDLGVTGMWVRIGGTDFRVIGQRDRRTILVEGASGAVSTGQAYRGIYRFDSVTVRGGARLVFGDPFEAGTTDVEPGSELWPYNEGEPVVDAGLISISAHDGAFWVAGTTGAVTDPDGLREALVRNTVSGDPVVLSVASDGSFPAVQVQGAVGDPLLIEAVDAHAVPRSSTTAIGSLPANTGPPVVATDALELAPVASGEWRVTGSTGAVADGEPPVIVTVTNTTAGSSASVVAAGDGSFSVTISGSSGDAVQLIALDGHPQQEQTTVDLGILPGNQPPAVDPAGLTVAYVGPGDEWGAHYEVRIAGGAITDDDAPIHIEITNPAGGETAGPWSLESGAAATFSLEGMTLETGAVLQLTATDSYPGDPLSTTVDLQPLPVDNYGPPEVDLSAIRIVSMGFGAMVFGNAEAITDPDGPIMVTLRTTDPDSGWSSGPFPVAEDGSFVRRIPGDPGAELTLEAMDSHPDLQLSTGEVVLGVLPDHGIRADAVDTAGHTVTELEGRLVLLDGGGDLARAQLRETLDEDWQEYLADRVSGIAPPVARLVPREPWNGDGPWYALSGGDLLVWLPGGGDGPDDPCCPAEIRPRSLSSGTLLAGRGWGGWLYLVADEGSSGLRLYTLAEPSIVEDGGNTRSLYWPNDGAQGVVSMGPSVQAVLAVVPGPPGRVAVVTDDPSAELQLADVTDPLAPVALGSVDLSGTTSPSWAAWDDGQLILGRNDGSVEIWRWNGSSMETVASWNPDTVGVSSARITGSQLWLGLEDGRLEQVDLYAPGGPRRLGEITLGTGAVHLSDLGGALLAGVDGQLYHLWVWELPPDLETGQVLWEADGEAMTLSVAVDRYRAYCGEDRSRVVVTWPHSQYEDVRFFGADWTVLEHWTSTGDAPVVEIDLCSGISGTPMTPVPWIPWDMLPEPFTLWPVLHESYYEQQAPGRAELVALGSADWRYWVATANRGATEVLASESFSDTGVVASTPLPAPGGVVGLWAHDQFLHVLSGGLTVWDLSDPSTPGEAASVALLGSDGASAGTEWMHMDESTEEMVPWLYAVGGSPPRLAVVKMGDPENPMLVGDNAVLPSAQGTALAVGFAGDSLLLLTGDNGTFRLLRYDVNDPSAPTLLSTVELQGSRPVSMAAGTDYEEESGIFPLVAIVREDDTIEFLDGADGSSLGSVTLPASPTSGVVMGVGGEAYVPLGNGYGLAAVTRGSLDGGQAVVRYGFGPGGAAACSEVSDGYWSEFVVLTTHGRVWSAGEKSGE